MMGKLFLEFIRTVIEKTVNKYAEAMKVFKNGLSYSFIYCTVFCPYKTVQYDCKLYLH